VCLERASDLGGALELDFFAVFKMRVFIKSSGFNRHRTFHIEPLQNKALCIVAIECLRLVQSVDHGDTARKLLELIT